MKIKPNRYYKTTDSIICTDTKNIYYIIPYRNKEKHKWGTIQSWNKIVSTIREYGIEEISKEDVFLELL